MLFFAGVSTKFDTVRVQQAMIATAMVLLIVGVTLLLSFPVEI